MSYCEKCGNQISENSKFCPGCGTPQNNTPMKLPAQSNITNSSGNFKRGEIIATSYCNYNSVRRFKIAETLSAVIAALFWLYYYFEYEDFALFYAIITSAMSTFFWYDVYITKNCYIHMYENRISGKAVKNYILRSFEVPYSSIADARVIANKKDDVLQLTIKNNFSNIQDIFSCHIVDPYEILKQIQVKINQ